MYGCDIYPRGLKEFELSNHLGNVHTVVSDRKVPYASSGTPTVIAYYQADQLMSKDYLPFGMQMLGRTFSNGEYRYGFNGQEMDNEVGGNGNIYTAEFCEYDARIGRRWNVDPVYRPNIASYATFGNNPIYYNDPDGANWDVKKTEKDGKTTYDISITGAVYNNSGQNIDMEKLKDKMVKQISEVYCGAGDANTTVNITVNLRVVENLNDVKSTDHLISIESDANYDKYAGSEGKGTNAYADIGGLKIIMPYRTANGLLKDNKKYHRTVAHELGHTGGLYHPDSFNGAIVQGVNKYDKGDNLNFMYSTGGKDVKVAQIKVIYDNFVNQRINQQTQFIHESQYLVFPSEKIAEPRKINYGHQRYVDWTDQLFGP